MNQMDERQLSQHVMILGWLYIVSSTIFLAVAAFIFFLLTGIGAVSGEPEALAILSVVATSLGAFLTILSLPGIAAGIGLLRRKIWGRVLAIVVGILNLINVPIGTLIGIYTLWVLLQDVAVDYFDPSDTSLQPHKGHAAT